MTKKDDEKPVINEVQSHDRELTPDEVAQRYRHLREHGELPPPVARYEFDGSEDALKDRTGHGHDLTASPAEEWCWREKDSEVAFGPFASREEAIEEAKVWNEIDAKTVMIGRCVYPDPVFTAGQVADLDHLLELMDEHVYDNGLPVDDSVFELKTDAKGAQEGLKRALMEWAKVFVAKPTSWHTSEQEEEVVICPPRQGAQGIILDGTLDDDTRQYTLVDNFGNTRKPKEDGDDK